MRVRSRQVGVVTAALALVAGLAGCGSSDSSTSSSGASSSSSPSASTSADPALAALVPDALKSDGKLIVGSDTTYAPNEFLDADGKTVKGFEVDLFKAVAAKLGLTTEFVPAPFDNIIPSILSGKYEVGVSSFTINAERVKKTDMVSYFSAGVQWAAPAGNPQKVSPDDACGKKIAVQKGTVEVDDITARSGKCTAAGKPAITIDQFQGQDQATAAVVSGKDDAMLADSPVTAYAVKQTNGKLELLGPIYDAAPYGFVIKKEQGEFGQAIAKALAAIKADGTYTKVLETWGVSQGAIADFAVNPAVK